MKNILVFGSGSVGTYLGVMLFSGGKNDVHLLGRRKIEKISDSIRINGVAKKLPTQIKKLSNTYYDMVFVTTKLYDVKEAIQEIKESGIEFKNIVFVQNGLVDENFYEDLKDHPGFCTLSIFEGFYLEGDELTAHESKLGWQIEGSSFGETIASLLRESGISASINENISKTRAEKMIFVSAVSALSAIHKKTLGELVQEEVTRALLNQLIDESYQVLKSKYSLPDLEEIRKKIFQTMRENADHFSSMYQDVYSERKTEIEFLNGFIVEMGRKNGIPTPINESVLANMSELKSLREGAEQQRIR